jgi:hypothetical protein
MVRAVGLDAGYATVRDDGRRCARPWHCWCRKRAADWCGSARDHSCNGDSWCGRWWRRQQLALWAAMAVGLGFEDDHLLAHHARPRRRRVAVAGHLKDAALLKAVRDTSGRRRGSGRRPPPDRLGQAALPAPQGDGRALLRGRQAALQPPLSPLSRHRCRQGALRARAAAQNIKKFARTLAATPATNSAGTRPVNRRGIRTPFWG